MTTAPQDPNTPENATAPGPAFLGPILAPSGASAAAASRPETPLDGSYHIYEAHPAPWWIAVLWVSYFVFAVTYLITNII